MQKVPIRVKLGATLLVPVLALVIVAALEMLAAKSENDRVHEQAELATLSLGPPSVLIQLELERNIAATYILGSEDIVALSVETNEEAWANTDVSVEEFRATVENRSGFVADTYAPVLEALGGLDDLRRQVDEYDGERSLEANPFAREVFDGYSAIMDVVYDANAQILPTIANRDLRRGAELADLSARQSDTTARILRELLFANFEGERNGIDTSDEIAGLAAVLGTLRRNEAAIDSKADGSYRALADELFATPHISEYPELMDQTLRGDDVDIVTALNTSTGSESGEFGYTVFSRRVNEQLRADADAVRSDADGRFLRYGLLAGAAMLIALVTTWLVSQSLTRPLRSLTRQAKSMAGDRLPNAVRSILNTPLGEDVEVPEMAPVVVKTRDEVGDVAEALNTVQETALELAVEQAVLRRNIADSFVNLGRRNQNLLGRQLDFITELESNETDPDTLASLFRLDHLATRMRRNAESLLVLAGIDPPRRWSAPVRLTDVIRAALGEVEDYQRVTVLGVEPAQIIGSAAADLAHLCAEFVENALTFSPPDQKVEIRGRNRDDGYTLAIIDNGFGMAPEDIERANRRLAGSESFTIAPSKYLGHYVAGNLAARHEVTVRLEPSPGSGVTAMIHLPPTLLADAARADASLGGTPAGAAGAPPAGPVPIGPFAGLAPASGTGAGGAAALGPELAALPDIDDGTDLPVGPGAPSADDWAATGAGGAPDGRRNGTWAGSPDRARDPRAMPTLDVGPGAGPPDQGLDPGLDPAAHAGTGAGPAWPESPGGDRTAAFASGDAGLPGPDSPDRGVPGRDDTGSGLDGSDRPGRGRAGSGLPGPGLGGSDRPGRDDTDSGLLGSGLPGPGLGAGAGDTAGPVPAWPGTGRPDSLDAASGPDVAPAGPWARPGAEPLGAGTGTGSGRGAGGFGAAMGHPGGTAEPTGSHWAAPGSEPEPGAPDGDTRGLPQGRRSAAGAPSPLGHLGGTPDDAAVGAYGAGSTGNGGWRGRAGEPASDDHLAGNDPRPATTGTPGRGALAPRTDSGRTERTASGLTKRTPRQDGPAAAIPQGQLLDALSRASRNADRRPGTPSGPVGLSPALPPPGARAGTADARPAAPTAGTAPGTGWRRGGSGPGPSTGTGWRRGGSGRKTPAGTGTPAGTTPGDSESAGSWSGAEGPTDHAGDPSSSGIPPAPDTTARPPLGGRRTGRRGLTGPNSGIGGPAPGPATPGSAATPAPGHGRGTGSFAGTGAGARNGVAGPTETDAGARNGLGSPTGAAARDGLGSPTGEGFGHDGPTGPEGDGETGRPGAGASTDAPPDAPWAALQGLIGARPSGAGPGRSGPAARTGTDQGETAGGLARRVPGAHMPSNGPVSIRRSDRDGGAPPGAAGRAGAGGMRPPGSGGAPAPGARPNRAGAPGSAPAGADVTGAFRLGGPGDASPGGSASPWSRNDRSAPPAPPAGEAEGTERAENVYSLLTSFTVGVQRGLDEAATGHSGSSSDRS